MTTQRVQLDPETSGTIFDEITLSATQTMQLHHAFVGMLDNPNSFNNLFTDALQELDTAANLDEHYGPLVEMGSAILLWLLWLRQQGLRNQYKPFVLPETTPGLQNAKPA